MTNTTSNHEGMRRMNTAIVGAVLDYVRAYDDLTADDVRNYFDNATRGMDLMLAFRPNRETFISNLVCDLECSKG